MIHTERQYSFHCKTHPCTPHTPRDITLVFSSNSGSCFKSIGNTIPSHISILLYCIFLKFWFVVIFEIPFTFGNVIFINTMSFPMNKNVCQRHCAKTELFESILCHHVVLRFKQCQSLLLIHHPSLPLFHKKKKKHYHYKLFWHTSFVTAWFIDYNLRVHSSSFC